MTVLQRQRPPSIVTLAAMALAIGLSVGSATCLAAETAASPDPGTATATDTDTTKPAPADPANSEPAKSEPTKSEPAPADVKEKATEGAEGTEGAAGSKVVLTPEEIAEKEGRKACKVDICTAFRNPKAAGGDISCNVLKSWRKEQLVKMVSRLKVTWPYGPVRCTSVVNIKRDDLVKAVTEKKHTATLEMHKVSCTVERDNDKPTEIKFEFAPKVDFADGKAVKAKMNWGKIEGPTLIKGAMWTATAADNTVNMLSSYLVTDINDFIDKKCDEVKEDWAARK